MFSWDLAALRIIAGKARLCLSLKFTDGRDEIYVGFSENLLSRLLTKEKISHYPQDEKN